MAQFLVPVLKQKKLSSKARWGIHLGVAEGHKAWRFLDVQTEEFVVARDAVFYETLTFTSWLQRRQELEAMQPDAALSSWSLQVPSEASQASSIAEELPFPVAAVGLPLASRSDDPPLLSEATPLEPTVPAPSRRSSRLAQKAAARPADLVCFQTALEPPAPRTYKEAMAENQLQWQVAMDAEMQMLAELGTWTLTDLPPDATSIGVKWVYRRKWDGSSYGTYKARLVAKGYSQRPGYDFDVTYAPVSSMITVRCLLAVVAARGLHLWQLDVKNTFLHGSIDRPIYVDQPPGFDDGGPRRYLLHKALYGLKQSPRCWFSALEAALVSAGFLKCPAEPALFFRDAPAPSDDGGEVKRIWVIVYVDDILFASALLSHLQQTFDELSQHFILKRIDPVDTYLGVQIVQNPATQKIFLHQQRYVEQSTAAVGDGSAVTPLTFGLRLDAEDVTPAEQQTTYLSKVGKLSYAATCTRPDLSFAHSWLAGGNDLRTLQYSQELERTLRYMKDTSQFGLLFEGGETGLQLQAYCDAGVQLHNYCTTGFVITFGGAAVAWKCERQERTSGSSASAEYRAAVAAAKEVIWLRFLLEFLECPQGAVPLHCDNKTAIQAMTGDSVRDMKEISRVLPFIRDCVKAGEVAPQFIPGKEQPADFLTKPLLGPAFVKCRDSVGMVRLSLSTGKPLLTASVAELRSRSTFLEPSTSEKSLRCAEQEKSLCSAELQKLPLSYFSTSLAFLREPSQQQLFSPFLQGLEDCPAQQSFHSSAQQLCDAPPPRQYFHLSAQQLCDALPSQQFSSLPAQQLLDAPSPQLFSSTSQQLLEARSAQLFSSSSQQLSEARLSLQLFEAPSKQQFASHAQVLFDVQLQQDCNSQPAFELRQLPQ